MINFDRVAKSLFKYFLYASAGIISFVFIGETLLQGLLWFFQLVPEKAIFGYFVTDKIQIDAGEFVTIIILMLSYFFAFGYLYDRLGPKRSE